MAKRILETVDRCVSVLGRRVENRDPIFYISEPVGLKFLGVVDRLRSLNKVVLFEHAPKKEK